MSGLYGSFEERLLTEIRRRYLESIQELVAGDYPKVVDVLYCDPQEWDELPDDREIATDG